MANGWSRRLCRDPDLLPLFELLEVGAPERDRAVACLLVECTRPGLVPGHAMACLVELAKRVAADHAAAITRAAVEPRRTAVLPRHAIPRFVKRAEIAAGIGDVALAGPFVE